MPAVAVFLQTLRPPSSSGGGLKSRTAAVGPGATAMIRLLVPRAKLPALVLHEVTHTIVLVILKLPQRNL